MAKRWYVETTTTGEHRFVSLKGSRSQGHRHHHHHDHECIKVSRDEWNALVDRERVLGETNKGLVAENCSLKTSLSAAQADAHQLRHDIIPQFQNQIASLIVDNDSLRRSIDNAGQHNSKHYREEERLRHKLDKVERENKELRDTNSDLRTRVECLSKQLEESCTRRVSDLLKEVDYWKEHCRFWKSKFEERQRRHDDTFRILEERTDKMKVYEEILKRRRII